MEGHHHHGSAHLSTTLKMSTVNHPALSLSTAPVMSLIYTIQLASTRVMSTEAKKRLHIALRWVRWRQERCQGIDHFK